MEELEEKTLHNNIDIIYKYTEGYLKDINKSIDNITTKLTSTLAFSGVILKFVDDMPSNSNEWIFKVGTTLCLIITIGCCVAGLYPKDAGEVIDPTYLLEAEQYRAEDEIIKLQIVRQWNKGIPGLKDLLEKRASCFSLAIGFLTTASLIFALKIILESIA